MAKGKVLQYLLKKGLRKTPKGKVVKSAKGKIDAANRATDDKYEAIQKGSSVAVKKWRKAHYPMYRKFSRISSQYQKAARFYESLPQVKRRERLAEGRALRKVAKNLSAYFDVGFRGWSKTIKGVTDRKTLQESVRRKSEHIALSQAEYAKVKVAWDEYLAIRAARKKK